MEFKCTFVVSVYLSNLKRAKVYGSLKIVRVAVFDEKCFNSGKEQSNCLEDVQLKMIKAEHLLGNFNRI